MEPLIAMLPALPLPDVPAVEPAVPAPLVEFVEPEPVDPELVVDPPLVDPAPLVVVLELAPVRAFVSMNCDAPMRALLEAEPAVPLVPVAPVVPLVPPPLRHPVTVIARLPAGF